MSTLFQIQRFLLDLEIHSDELLDLKLINLIKFTVPYDTTNIMNVSMSG